MAYDSANCYRFAGNVAMGHTAAYLSPRGSAQCAGNNRPGGRNTSSYHHACWNYYILGSCLTLKNLAQDTAFKRDRCPMVTRRARSNSL